MCIVKFLSFQPDVTRKKCKKCLTKSVLCFRTFNILIEKVPGKKSVIYFRTLNIFLKCLARKYTLLPPATTFHLLIKSAWEQCSHAPAYSAPLLASVDFTPVPNFLDPPTHPQSLWTPPPKQFSC